MTDDLAGAATTTAALDQLGAVYTDIAGIVGCHYQKLREAGISDPDATLMAARLHKRLLRKFAAKASQ